MRIVVSDPRGQDFGLPGPGRGLKALKLLDHLQQAVFAPEPVVRINALPAQQIPYEGGLRHRLHLTAEPAYGAPVDTGQYAAVAELLFRSPQPELPSERQPLSLNLSQGYPHVGHG